MTAKITITEEKISKFCQDYLRVLRGTFAGLNLTALESDELFEIKQVRDSIGPLLVEECARVVLWGQIKKAKLIVDVGFGGGFPLLPLAAMTEGVRFLGVESREKKARAVGEIAATLGLAEKVTLVHQRLEAICFDRPAVVTFKAVGSCRELLKSMRIREGVEIVCAFYKGPNFRELEGDELKSIELEWELVEEIEYPLVGTQGRSVLCFKKRDVSSHAKRKQERMKPRSEKKTLVNLSDFL